MNLRKSFAILSISAVAAFAVGCGGGGEKQSDADQIKSNFGAAIKSLSDGNGEGWCAQLTAESRSRFNAQYKNQTGGASCAEAVVKLFQASKALKNGDWNSFCANISPEAAKGLANGLGGKGTATSRCALGAREIAKSPAGKAVFASVRRELEVVFSRMKAGQLTNIKVSGDSATASFASKSGGASTKIWKFSRVDGQWKISN